MFKVYTERNEGYRGGIFIYKLRILHLVVLKFLERRWTNG